MLVISVTKTSTRVSDLIASEKVRDPTDTHVSCCSDKARLPGQMIY